MGLQTYSPTPRPDVDWESELISDIAKFTHNPLGFVKYAWDWKNGELASSGGPRDWQKKILVKIGEHLRNPETRFKPLQIAVASGHGPGKSALISQLTNWGISTFEDTRIVVSASKGEQLRNKTWPEESKWFRLAINSHWWEVRATSIVTKQKSHEQTWRADQTIWSEENIEGFSGLHNEGKRLLIIFDEASGIPDKIWEVQEGALTDANTEIIWLAFGNPTQNTGRFRECFGIRKHRWHTVHVDSRTVEGTNKQQFEQWVDDYGEDSDFVRVRVRGEFPRAGTTQLIANDIVARARKFKAEGFEDLPKILSCDVARFGDDQTVIGYRWGRKCVVLGKYRGLATTEVTSKVIEALDHEKPDGIVVDGDGIGAGVVDQLRDRGYGQRLFEFHGGEKPEDGDKYYNKRAECWGLMRDWFEAGSQIPDDPEFETDLTGPQYGFSAKQQIQLEKKEDMKKRGLASPDSGDMLAMTFAIKVRSHRKKEMKLVYPGAFNSSTWLAN